nr:helix-turn-helix transcriptional regulator [Streptococcus constellatus]
MTNICCNKIVKGEYGMKLRNRLKELRARDRLNQTELARKAGISRQTVSLIEQGEYAPSVIIALKIAHIFGENVENVVYLEENSNEKMDEN